jgi:hypothetical protein
MTPSHVRGRSTRKEARVSRSAASSRAGHSHRVRRGVRFACPIEARLRAAPIARLTRLTGSLRVAAPVSLTGLPAWGRRSSCLAGQRGCGDWSKSLRAVESSGMRGWHWMVQKGGARRAGLGPPLARYSYECPDVVPGGGVAEAVESGLPLSVMVTDTGVPGSQAFRAARSRRSDRRSTRVHHGHRETSKRGQLRQYPRDQSGRSCSQMVVSALLDGLRDERSRTGGPSSYSRNPVSRQSRR